MEKGQYKNTSIGRVEEGGVNNVDKAPSVKGIPNSSCLTHNSLKEMIKIFIYPCLI